MTDAERRVIAFEGECARRAEIADMNAKAKDLALRLQSFARASLMREKKPSGSISGT